MLRVLPSCKDAEKRAACFRASPSVIFYSKVNFLGRSSLDITARIDASQLVSRLRRNPSLPNSARNRRCCCRSFCCPVHKMTAGVKSKQKAHFSFVWELNPGIRSRSPVHLHCATSSRSLQWNKGRPARGARQVNVTARE